MKNVLNFLGLAIFFLFILASCEKPEPLEIDLGDDNWQVHNTTNTTYGDTTFIVGGDYIIYHGDYWTYFDASTNTTITIDIFVEIGDIITVTDGILVYGDFEQTLVEGNIVYDESTNTFYEYHGDYWIGDDNSFYQYDNSTSTWINIEVTNLTECCPDCDETQIDTIYINTIDTTILIIPNGYKGVPFTTFEHSWMIMKLVSGTGLEFIGGGEKLLASAVNVNANTLAPLSLTYNNITNEYDGFCPIRLANQEFTFTLASTSIGGVDLTDDLGYENSQALGPVYQEQFLMELTSAIPSMWYWGNDQMLRFGGSSSNNLIALFIPLTQGVYDWAETMNVPGFPSQLGVRGWIAVPELDDNGQANQVFDHFSKTATDVADFVIP